MLKSIAVVVGSYVLSVILVFATNPLLSRLFPGDFVHGHVPSNKALLASTICFAIIAVICAWVCARFAPSKPGKHVLWFFVLGEVMGIAFTIPNWNKGWPHWYSIAWLVIWPIASYVGTLLVGNRSVSASAAAAR